MAEKDPVAAEDPTPAVDAAVEEEAPAAPLEPSPEKEPVTKAELKAEIASLREELRAKTEEANESGRRAQRTADSQASRLEKRIERYSALLDEVATRGMDEPDIRAWKYRQEAEREREKSAGYDAESQERKAREDFASYSSQVLTEEQIDRENPVFKEAWNRYIGQAKDQSDWKVALTRAVADVRKNEAKTARDDASKAAERAREDERAKARNVKRQAAGPIDNGAVGSVSQKSVADMTDAEFDAVKAQVDEQRMRRRMAMIR